MSPTQQILVTFVGAVLLGVLCIILAHRLKVATIVILLPGGILAGPECLNLIRPDTLGDGLKPIIALAVSLILFEGGLNLDPKAYRQISKEIRRLLTTGVMITWFATTLVISLIFGFALEFCLLAASLVIVTGPTVIGPLLKRVAATRKIRDLLYWEGILIDPIGVFIALLCYEWIVSGGEYALGHFILRFVVGAGLGLVGGMIVAYILQREWVRDEQLNIFVIANALFIFIVSDLISMDSGLLSVAVAGLVVSYFEHPHLAKVRIYKAELIELLLAMLFVLLAANLKMEAFAHYGWQGIMAALAVMLAVRPMNIFCSLMRTRISFREKVFLSWVSPRGIVAASMAALFALNFKNSTNPHSIHADFLYTFTYTVIAGTVLLQGITTYRLGRILGVLEIKPTGWLIIGAHKIGRAVAAFIESKGMAAVLVDTNTAAVNLAQEAGLQAICHDAMTLDFEEYPSLYNIGNVLAITEGANLNALVCQHWRQVLPKARLYRWGGGKYQDSKKTPLLVGQSVWDNLPLKEIMGDDCEVCSTLNDVELSRLRHPEDVLLCLYQNEIVPSVPATAKERGAILVYQPFAMPLSVKLKPEWVRLSQATSFRQAIEELLLVAHQDYPQLQPQILLDQLLQNESDYYSLVGYGIAMAHIYTAAVEESPVFIAKLAEPVPCEHEATANISAIFLVLSNSKYPQRHLHTLSQISKFIMNDQYRTRLLEIREQRELADLFFHEV